MTSTVPVAQVLPGGVVVLSGSGVVWAARSLAAYRKTAARDGVPLSGDVGVVLEALTKGAQVVLSDVVRVPTSVFGSAEVPFPADLALSSVDGVSVVEAARMLGCTERNVRDLAGRGALGDGTRRVGGRWLVDRSGVAAHRARQERRTA